MGFSLATNPGLHELFADPIVHLTDPARTGSPSRPNRGHPTRWGLPAALVIGTGLEALDGRAVWVGRRSWCSPIAIARALGPEMLGRIVWADPSRRDERVWAIETALRCPAVGLVVGDGSGLSMAESRRLQLVATDRQTPCLLARPPSERGELSAARTRWLISPLAQQGEQAWTLELLRCKGMQPSEWSARRWVVRRDHATGRTQVHEARDVGLAAHVGDRSRQTPTQQQPEPRKSAG